MKKITTFLALLFLAVAFGQVQTFKFEDNLTNEGSPAITLNGTNETFIDGLPGKGRALEFNQPAGTSGTFRAVGNINNQPQGDNVRSFSFWLKVAAPANNASNRNSDIFFIGSAIGSTSPHAGFGFRRAPAVPSANTDTRFELFNGTTIFAAVEGGNNSFNDVWRFYTITYSADNYFRIYIDGSLVTSNQISGGGLLNTGSGIRFGGGTQGNLFAIDNFEIHDSTLSNATVASIYRDQIKPAIASPQAYCNGATTGAIAIDEFPNFTAVKYYTDPINNTFVAAGTALVSGTYYISQSVNSVESNRTPVVISLSTTPTPSSLPASISICDVPPHAGSNLPTVAGLTLKWYYSETGSAVQPTDAMPSTNNLWVSSIANNCESPRINRGVTFNYNQTPTGNAAQTLPPGSNLTNIVVTPSFVNYFISAANATNNVSQLPNNTLLTNGTTYYAVNVSNGCRSMGSFAVTITIGALSNESFDDKLKFNLSPNPTKNILNIAIATELKSVEFFALDGKKVFSSDQKEINVSGLAKGIYMVKVTDENNAVATQKMVKE